MMTACQTANKMQCWSWFQPTTKTCKETRRAEMVALLLDQDEFRITNTLDGLDLADVVIQRGFNPPQEHELFAPLLRLDMLPCLQPGTIVHVNDHRWLVNFCFDTVRPHVQVPCILMTSESDCCSPSKQSERLGADHQSLKWRQCQRMRMMTCGSMFKNQGDACMCFVQPCVAFHRVSRLEGASHLRRGAIAVVATSGCHGTWHLVRSQHTIEKSSYDDDFPTNPHALSILASFPTKWQG
jgi:hypothetical protein